MNLLYFFFVVFISFRCLCLRHCVHSFYPFVSKLMYSHDDEVNDSTFCDFTFFLCYSPLAYNRENHKKNK